MRKPKTINEIINEWKIISDYHRVPDHYYELEHFKLDHFAEIIQELQKLKSENKKIINDNKFLLRLKGDN